MIEYVLFLGRGSVVFITFSERSVAQRKRRTNYWLIGEKQIPWPVTKTGDEGHEKML